MKRPALSRLRSTSISTVIVSQRKRAYSVNSLTLFTYDSAVDTRVKRVDKDRRCCGDVVRNVVLGMNDEFLRINDLKTVK